MLVRLIVLLILIYLVVSIVFSATDPNNPEKRTAYIIGYFIFAVFIVLIFIGKFS
jgi:hypothetical protein